MQSFAGGNVMFSCGKRLILMDLKIKLKHAVELRMSSYLEIPSQEERYASTSDDSKKS
jgi:hypothetical protein